MSKMLEFSVHEVSVFSENERERMIIWVVWCAVAGFVRGFFINSFRCVPEQEEEPLQYLRRDQSWNDVLYYCPTMTHELIGPIQRKCVNGTVWEPKSPPVCHKVESCPEESRISDDDTESALKVNNYWIFCKRGYAKQDDLLSCTNYIQWATQLKNKRRKCAPKDDDNILTENGQLVVPNDKILDSDEVDNESAEERKIVTEIHGPESEAVVWSVVFILFVFCQCLIIYIMYKFKTRVLNSFQVTLANSRAQTCAT
ncbi:uncharacterized protein LOC136028737 [Artemia franciscana]|uniref:Sushi domain-containing protein n=1 Tax=Artemia franciscana TaxID=6661 RepID=A0AA88HKA7_ARTSF|nr:hypothetical protein QYM36_014834 [Artemia franciscana]